MDGSFKLEIISPEKIIFSDNVTMVTLPSYEGDMRCTQTSYFNYNFFKARNNKNSKKWCEF